MITLAVFDIEEFAKSVDLKGEVRVAAMRRKKDWLLVAQGFSPKGDQVCLAQSVIIGDNELEINRFRDDIAAFIATRGGEGCAPRTGLYLESLDSIPEGSFARVGRIEKNSYVSLWRSEAMADALRVDAVRAAVPVEFDELL